MIKKQMRNQTAEELQEEIRWKIEADLAGRFRKIPVKARQALVRKLTTMESEK